MTRQLRVQYPGAIYHVTSRGNRRQDIVSDDLDRNVFFERIGTTVAKYCWEMFAAVLMINHFHLFFRTPQPNLSRGMQFLLGGYAAYFNQRHERVGHLFQGRFRSRLIEDESYFWCVSRYVHLNPVPVLVPRPELWPWSSYAGYVDPRLRLPWIAYDTLLAAWQGQWGGQDPLGGYRQYVEAELGHPPTSPFDDAIDGWILGSQQFADRIRKLVSPESHEPQVERARRMAPLDLVDLQRSVCEFYEIEPAELAVRGSRHPARIIFASLARSHTAATLAELSDALGLSRRDSVPNLLRRIESVSPEVRQQLALIRLQMGL